MRKKERKKKKERNRKGQIKQGKKSTEINVARDTKLTLPSVLVCVCVVAPRGADINTVVGRYTAPICHHSAAHFHPLLPWHTLRSGRSGALGYHVAQIRPGNGPSMVKVRGEVMR